MKNMVNGLNFDHLNTVFLLKIVVTRAGISNICVRLANRKDSDQTASSEACTVCLGLFGRLLVFKLLEHICKERQFSFNFF